VSFADDAQHCRVTATGPRRVTGASSGGGGGGGGGGVLYTSTSSRASTGALATDRLDYHSPPASHRHRDGVGATDHRSTSAQTADGRIPTRVTGSKPTSLRVQRARGIAVSLFACVAATSHHNHPAELITKDLDVRHVDTVPCTASSSRTRRATLRETRVAASVGGMVAEREIAESVGRRTSASSSS